MTIRRLAVLVDGLPPDAAVHRTGHWTLEHELAAVAIERAELWHATHIAMLAAKRSKLPPCIAITHPDRPVRKPQRKKAISAREIAARWGR